MTLFLGKIPNFKIILDSLGKGRVCLEPAGSGLTLAQNYLPVKVTHLGEAHCEALLSNIILKFLILYTNIMAAQISDNFVFQNQRGMNKEERKSPSFQSKTKITILKKRLIHAYRCE